MPEIAIVGAGITGLSVALHLAERGERSIVLHERAGVGVGASALQPGGVRLQWGTGVNCRMARESLDFYLAATERLRARADLRFRACGYLFVVHSRQALARLAASVELQNRLGVPSRVVGPEEAATLAPGLDSSRITGASFCPRTGTSTGRRR